MNDAPSVLVETPGNPVPYGLTGGYLTTADGRRLRYAVARSRLPSTRGTVVLLQGRNEAIEKYFETISDLTRRGFGVATFDWRGQGGSDRLTRSRTKGHVRKFDAYAEDLDSFLKEVVLPDCRAPYAMLAHSMGGLVALAATPRLINRIERLVLIAPLVALPGGSTGSVPLRLGLGVLHVLGFGRLSVRRVRARTGPDALALDPSTSDQNRFERNRRLAEAAPQLFVPRLTASWLRAAIKAMRRLDDSDVIAGLHLPTLIVTAGVDRVVSTRAVERLAWRMRSGHLLSIPGSRHEILQEAARFREPFLAAFEAFVAGALPMRSDAAPTRLPPAPRLAHQPPPSPVEDAQRLPVEP